MAPRLIKVLGAPKPFDEDVVQRTASPIHTDGDLALFENPGEYIARELRTLIRDTRLPEANNKGSGSELVKLKPQFLTV